MKTNEIIKRLEVLGLRKVDIASRVGVSTQTIYGWSKKRNPHRVFVKKLEELLNEVEARTKKGSEK